MAEDADIFLSPAGALCHPDGTEITEPAAQCFELAGTNDTLPPASTFWRTLTRKFLTDVCRTHAPEQTIPFPALSGAEELMAARPPVRGMEFLSHEVLESLWKQMHHELERRCLAGPRPLTDVLTAILPALRAAGRVTLHLAENKNNPELPFAFLATYTIGINSSGQPRHVPLGKAVRDSADQQAGELTKTLAPVTLAAQRCPWLAQLLESKRLFQALAWTPTDAYAMLHDIPVLEECGLVVRIPDWWEPRRPPQPSITISLDAKPGASTLGAHGLLAFKIGAAIGDEPLTEDDIRKLEQSKAPLVSLKGKWVEVDREKWGQAMAHWRRAEIANAQGIPFHLGLRWLAGFSAAASTPSGEPDQSRSLVRAEAGTRLTSFLAQLESASRELVREPSGLQASLRPYQKSGLAWLHFLTSLGLGACLADDMGLGKTLQLIALLLLRRESGECQHPSLLVVPASLLGNWQTELLRFAPSLPFSILHRSTSDRADIAHSLSAPSPGSLLITTYSMLGRIPGLLEREYDCAILDEAQAIKNSASSLAIHARKINARARIALTGTPVENRLDDLWSLFEFLNPGLLGSATEFAASLKHMSASPEGFAPLRKLVRPFILRRMKSDPTIAPDLPEKTEVRVWCHLGKRQAALYQRAVNALAAELSGSAGVSRQGAILSTLLRLKQICNHPSLWSGDGSFAPEDSGKFSRLADLALLAREAQEKMLVFTQFREMTQPLADFLAVLFGRPGLVLHGSTPVEMRPALVAQFQAPSGPPFFVISLKAGGSGLNLTAASHVVHFDRWWNPAVENQATDRAFRIGQKRNVLVHKFITAGTLEERIDQLIFTKQELADDILETGSDAARSVTNLTDKDLLDFLNFHPETLSSPSDATP